MSERGELGPATASPGRHNQAPVSPFLRLYICVGHVVSALLSPLRDVRRLVSRHHGWVLGSLLSSSILSSPCSVLHSWVCWFMSRTSFSVHVFTCAASLIARATWTRGYLNPTRASRGHTVLPQSCLLCLPACLSERSTQAWSHPPEPSAHALQAITTLLILLSSLSMLCLPPWSPWSFPWWLQQPAQWVPASTQASLHCTPLPVICSTCTSDSCTPFLNTPPHGHKDKALRGVEALRSTLASLDGLPVALAQSCRCSRHRPLNPFDTSPTPTLCSLLPPRMSSSSGQRALVPFLHSPCIHPARGLSSIPAPPLVALPAPC